MSRLGKFAIQFGAPDRPLFGWFHAGAAVSARNCGVVVCSPVGGDAVRAHRALRHLCEKLAAAGFPTVRFDFHGTGDSSGDERAPARVSCWLNDVFCAMDELRARSRVQRLVVVGMRLGATLAAAAAGQRSDVDGLVLWAPYLRGGAFAEEFTRMHETLARVEPGNFSLGPPEAGGAEALGFFLSHETLSDLHDLDLAMLERAPAPAVLLISAELALAREMTALLEPLGVIVTARHLPGQQKFLMDVPHRAALPEESLAVIMGWMDGRYPPATLCASVGPRPTRLTPIGDEEPIVFGEGRPRFGVLAHARGVISRGSTDAPDRPAVLMINAGCVPRTGPHRFYVRLARRWAALGWDVLRLDLSGIGDTPVEPGAIENLPYPPGGAGDLRAAMDYLGARLGHERFIVMGLCSGADWAFQIAADEPRVAGTVLMNPRTFGLIDGHKVDTYQIARWYQSSLGRKVSWVKLLRGQVNVLDVARLVGPKVRDFAAHRAGKILHALVPRASRGRLGEASGDEMVVGRLRRMVERGVETLVVVAAHDPGIDYLDATCGKAMRDLRGLSGYRRVDLHGTDHTFTAIAAREIVSDLITDHLKCQHLAGGASPLDPVEREVGGPAQRYILAEGAHSPHSRQKRNTVRAIARFIAGIRDRSAG